MGIWRDKYLQDSLHQDGFQHPRPMIDNYRQRFQVPQI